MFLNPWYGQVGGGPEGGRVHTAEEGTAATATAAAAASGVGSGDDEDDRVLPTTATSTSSSSTAANAQQQQVPVQQATAFNSIKAATSVDNTEATAAMSGDVAAVAVAFAATPVNRFEMIQQSLKSGWTAHVTQDGRLFYCNHINQTSSWLPPIDNWNGSSIQLQSSTVVDGATSAAEAAAGPPLPYGWEAATDRDGRAYFINHLNKTTTYEDPRRGDWGGDEPPQPRNVELCRHPELGFGFVAGSEKPVIVRFVTEGGPSVDKLLPGDQIWRINGEDVKNAPRDHVIQLVRSCKETVHLSVCQPPLDNSTRKSALLSAAKKAKLRNNPSRVRFAEGVVINGTTLPLSQSLAAHVRSDVAGVAESAGAPLMPNVMKVYLENGQTKSFKYDSATTVADVLNSLQQKLGFKSMDHFSLCVEHVKSIRKNKLTLLDPAESLAWIAARPGAHNLRCMLRVAFVPKDAYDLLRKDMGAFEYLYMQCCNDVVQERFAPELKYDIALRIAALHMHQHAITNKMQAKLTVKNIEREYGLERFVPTSLVEAMKRKELRKLLSHFVKVNQQLTAPGQKQLTALQAKLHYLKIIAELPSYGAKCFSTNFKSDANVETVILVSPKYGISQISGMRSSAPLTLCNIEDITSLNVRREDELTQYVEIRLKDPDKETLVLSLEERDSEEIILVLRGYHKLATDRVLAVHRERSRWTQDSAPPYHTRHTVQPSTWNFVDRPEVGNRTASAPTAEGGETTARQIHYADLSVPPPYHPPPPGFQLPSTRYPSSVSDQDEEASVEREFDDPEEPATERLYDSPRSLRLGDVSLALSPLPVNKLDSNMNKPLPNNNSTAGQQQHQQHQGNQLLSRLPILSSVVRQSPTTPRRVSTLETAVPSHKLGFDMPSVVSMEILESQHPQRQQKMKQQQQSGDCSEARNDAVIQRVSELKRLVEDAEQYLTGGSGNGLMTNRVSDVETSSLLSELSKTESDQSGSGTGAGYGRLRHSDSLLLLTTGQKQLSLPDNSTILLDAHDHASSSDADTDSVASTPHATPTHSPMQRPKLNETSSAVASGGGSSRPPSMLKPSDSSFGLHSPDVLMPMTNGVGGEGEEKDLEGLLRRLQDDLPLAEGSLLYLDPDIIDLTMIPPPITPEEEGLKMKFPATINEPPTPFADRDSLENELVAIKQQQQLNRSRMNGRPSASELGELQDLTDLAQWTDVVSNSSKTRLDGNDSEDTLSLSGISGTALSSGRSIESLASSSSSITSPSVLTLTESKRRWIADEKRKHLATNPELDAFLSTVAVPLPPAKSHLSNSSQATSNQNGSSSLFNNDDLSAYIIPPPPANVATTSNNGLAILQKLYAAREGIFQVMNDDTVPSSPAPSTKEFDEEKDRGMAEMRVKFEQRVPNQGVSSKMSDIQRFLSSTSNNQSSTHQTAPVEATTANTKGTTPDLSPASSHSSGYGSLKSISDSNSTAPELPARQPAGQFSPRKNGFVHFKSPVAQHRFINGTSSSSFRPTFVGDDDDDDDIPPPPPPPRNPIPRMILATATAAGIRSPTNSSSSQTSTAAPPPGPLTKSSSQGDLLGRTTSTSVPNVAKMTDANRVRTEEGRTKGMSASTESISTVDKANSGTSSPSKLSMASSSDSIGSNASVATVKNAPINSTFNSTTASPSKASVVTNGGGGDTTPPLPPRNSPTRVVMRPPIPAQQHVDTVKVIVNNRSRTGTGPISPASPLTPDSPSSPKPPALPSRLRKPGVTSPVHNKPAAPGRPIVPINGGPPQTQLRSPVKAMAPPPPVIATSTPTPVPVSLSLNNVKMNGVESNHYAVPSLTKPAQMTMNGSPTKHSNTSSAVPNEYQTPNTSRLPRPLTNGSPVHSRGQPGAPLYTSSPKMGARTNASSIGNNVISLNIRVDGNSKNGSSSNSPTWMSPQHNGVRGKTTAVVHGGPEDNGSLDSGSFEQDSLDGSADFDLGALVGQSEMTVNRVISRLAIPVPTGQPPKLTNGHEETEAARERLINESRQFVTASKMFVKSVTDSPQSMAVCMQQCVTLVERMGQAAEEVAHREHSRDLPPKVRDVARAFLHTLRAAAEASGQGVSDPSMGRLMGKATALAGVLTILMRSLRT